MKRCLVTCIVPSPTLNIPSRIFHFSYRHLVRWYAVIIDGGVWMLYPKIGMESRGSGTFPAYSLILRQQPKLLKCSPKR